jgi:hypothetical protein
MSDVSGQARALMVLTPVIPGREAALHSYLEALPPAEGSPLAAVPSTHFARWLVIDELVQQGPPQKPDHLSCPYLLFTSNFDGELDAYLDQLLAAMAKEADEIWGACVGYPGSGDPRAFKEYLTHNRIPTTFFVSAYPQATVDDVRSSMALRAQITDFAIRAQGLDAEARRRAFLGEFDRESG